MTRIRHADRNDMPWLLDQLRNFSTFYGTKQALFGDEKYAAGFVAEMIKDHLVIIAERDDVGLVGFIAGFVSHHPYNPQIRLLSEAFWWVDEKHRGTRAGLKLFNAFVAWGKEHADWVTFALEHHSPVDDRLLLNRGFKLQERNYLLEVT